MHRNIQQLMLTVSVVGPAFCQQLQNHHLQQQQQQQQTCSDIAKTHC